MSPVGGVTCCPARLSYRPGAHDISVKLGYYDLSSVALDRMDWAAHRALVYFREGEYMIGRRLVAVGHGIVGAAEQTGVESGARTCAAVRSSRTPIAASGRS